MAFENYFGPADASCQPIARIVAEHLPRCFEKDLKLGSRSTGKHTIVGIKGSGKTDLRRYIEKNNPGIVLNLDADNTYMDIDASAVKSHSGILKNYLAFEILRTFADLVAAQHKEYGVKSKAKKILVNGVQRSLEIIKQVPSAVKIDTVVGEIDLNALLKSKKSSFVQNAWNDLRRSVISALDGQTAYIMIDDTEDVFPGMEGNPLFIEGLVRAIHEINQRCGARLHAMIFMKYGVYRQWLENPRELDKVSGAIEEISWNHESLCNLLARRIAVRHKIKTKSIDPEQMWKKEFDWGRKMRFEDFARNITQYCVNGPRDLIVLANESKKLAKERRIQREHIDGVLKKYSQNKIYGINADFGDVYKNIHKFVEIVFQKCPAEIRGMEVAEWIDKHAMLKERVDKEFSEYPWYSMNSKERIAALMYEIGVLGRKVDGRDPLYSMEKPTESISELMGSILTVHPAFRPHLNVH